jgi:hypothetical protein
MKESGSVRAADEVLARRACRGCWSDADSGEFDTCRQSLRYLSPSKRSSSVGLTAQRAWPSRHPRNKVLGLEPHLVVQMLNHRAVLHCSF